MSWDPRLDDDDVLQAGVDALFEAMPGTEVNARSVQVRDEWKVWLRIALRASWAAVAGERPPEIEGPEALADARRQLEVAQAFLAGERERSAGLAEQVEAMQAALERESDGVPVLPASHFADLQAQLDVANSMVVALREQLGSERGEFMDRLKQLENEKVLEGRLAPAPERPLAGHVTFLDPPQ